MLVAVSICLRDYQCVPFAKNRGVRIYWEERGQGDPVLMIMGMSFTLDMWHRLVPAVAATHRAILMDNRGVGRSDIPRGPYSIRQMANDALAVLNHAGAKSAYVMGASMGGMVAQELALQAPDRVTALLLGCTSAGTLRGKFPEMRHMMRVLAVRKATSREEREWMLAPLLYARGTPDDLIAEDIKILSRHALTRMGGRLRRG